MIVSLIVAMDEAGGIAYQDSLPWHLPAELKLFKQATTGHHLLMGRKTFETIKKPLPDRTTIVVTRQPDYQPQGCLVVHSLQDGITLAKARGETELFVCGGADIFAQSQPHADRIYLTVVHATVEADLVFPPINPDKWQESETVTHPADEKNKFAFTRRILDKKPLSKVDKP